MSQELKQTYSEGSMHYCYQEFIEFFPFTKDKYPSYEKWMCSDNEDARIFRQAWSIAYTKGWQNKRELAVEMAAQAENKLEKLQSSLKLWRDMPAQEMRLHCGEMSNLEILSVRSVLNHIINQQ